MMTMKQKTLQHVMTNSAVDTTLTMVATMVGLSRKTAMTIVESGLSMMADVADGDLWVFKAMYAQSIKLLPQPTPEFYAKLKKNAAARQAMTADFKAIYGQQTESNHRDAAGHASASEEQVRQVLEATMPAVVSTHFDRPVIARQLVKIFASVLAGTSAVRSITAAESGVSTVCIAGTHAASTTSTCGTRTPRSTARACALGKEPDRDGNPDIRDAEVGPGGDGQRRGDEGGVGAP